MNSRLTRITVVLLAAATSAFAQNNSLLGGRRPSGVVRAPTTQPATTQPATGAPPAGEVRVQPSGATKIDPERNEILLNISPFAVEKPKPQKIKVHDQVTIIVRESKTAVSDAKFESNRDWKHEWTLTDWVRLASVNGLVPAQFQAGEPKVKFDYKNDYGTDGKYDRKDELTTRIQATVLDVKPNGTLVLEATKAIEIDEEGYKISLTGICRSDDVTPQNTVLSTQIADMQIDVEHRGAVRDATQRGWIQRALDFLKPF